MILSAACAPTAKAPVVINNHVPSYLLQRREIPPFPHNVVTAEDAVVQIARLENIVDVLNAQLEEIEKLQRQDTGAGGN